MEEQVKIVTKDAKNPGMYREWMHPVTPGAFVPVTDFMPKYDFNSDQLYLGLISVVGDREREFAKAYVMLGHNGHAAANLICPGNSDRTNKQKATQWLKLPEVRNLIEHLDKLFTTYGNVRKHVGVRKLTDEILADHAVQDYWDSRRAGVDLRTRMAARATAMDALGLSGKCSTDGQASTRDELVRQLDAILGVESFDIDIETLTEPDTESSEGIESEPEEAVPVPA